MTNAANPIALASAVTAARLREWLLSGVVQLSGADPESGGVAGVLDADGRPRYVYAEITGYYLSWLADVATIASAPLVRERARLAVDWSTRAFGVEGRLPQTRIYLSEAEPDWRNDAVFMFDLAMLVHGIETAIGAGLVADPVPLREALQSHIQTFVADGELRCAVQVRGTAALPARWSTRGGPFLVKASSRVARAAAEEKPDSALVRACARDIERWADVAGEVELGMLHPTLYFAEGLLLARPDRAPAIATLLQRILATTHDDGGLPETADGSPRTRNDILAQALRVGILLRELDVPHAPPDADLDRLAVTLLERIGERPFVAFNADTAKQANVWCTMFAEQALRWHAALRDADARRPSAAALV